MVLRPQPSGRQAHRIRFGLGCPGWPPERRRGQAEQGANLIPGQKVSFQGGDGCSHLAHRGKVAACRARRFREQTLVVTLEQQERLGVPVDDLNQSSPEVGRQRQALGRLAYQCHGRFKFKDVASNRCLSRVQPWVRWSRRTRVANWRNCVPRMELTRYPRVTRSSISTQTTSRSCCFHLFRPTKGAYIRSHSCEKAANFTLTGNHRTPDIWTSQPERPLRFRFVRRLPDTR